MSQPKYLHVGILTPSFGGVSGVDSGIGTHFRCLADGLVAAGHQVTVVLTTGKPLANVSLPYPVEVAAIRLPRIAALSGRISWQLHRWWCLRAATQAAERRCALQTVDVWETTSTEAPARTFLRRRKRAPVATRVSTTASQLQATNAGPRTWVQRAIEEWEAEAVHRSDRVITHSPSHQAAIAQEFSLAPDAVTIIPHGIPLPPKPTRIPDREKCRVLFVGRLEHRKGIDLLLAALPETLAAAPKVEVTIVGTDPDAFWQGHWRRSAPSSLANRVTFAGMISPTELVEQYASADVFVGPSRYESFGLVFVEAMAHALPVVALRAPGAMDLIEEDRTGVLVPPENPPALAEAITRLAMDSSRRARLGAAGRAVVEERYSVPALVRGSCAFYRCILDRE